MIKPNYTDNDFERIPKFDPRVTPDELANKIQASVDSLISKCNDVDWNEDLITYKIVCDLRNILMSYKLPGILNECAENKFNFEAYKLTGNAEQAHGDIAFIITRKIYGIEEPISGVAFYEAKASGNGYERHEYPSFNIQQLRRLVTNTPKLSYLIYNREKREVSEGGWPKPPQYHEKESWDFSSHNKFHAVSIDANFLKQCRNITTASLAVGQPFGYHFVKRVLSGLDLDYSRSVDNTIRRWLKYTKKSAPLIVSVSVHEEKEDRYSVQLKLTGFEKIENLSYQPNIGLT